MQIFELVPEQNDRAVVERQLANVPHLVDRGVVEKE
jgi:hypothetical protein